MNYKGDITAGATIRWKFNTKAAGGAPATISSGALVAYKNDSTTQTSAGLTLTADFDGVTGAHHVVVDTSADAFYAAGSDIQVMLSAGTVDGVSVAGTVIGEFSIENRNTKANVTHIAGTPQGAGIDLSTVLPQEAYGIDGGLIINGFNQGECYFSRFGGFLRRGVAQAATNTTITLSASESDETDVFVGHQVIYSYQARRITAYNGTTKVATIDRAWVHNPEPGVEYFLYCLDTPKVDANGSIARVTLVDALTGHTPQTGDAYAIVNSGTHGNEALKTLIDTVDNFIDTEVAAIKAKTDQLTFTTPNKVDSTPTHPVLTDLAAMIAAQKFTEEALENTPSGGSESGSGARTVTVTVRDEDDNLLQGATVRFAEGVNNFLAITNASGVATFALDDATYTMAVTKPGYTHTPASQVVDGNESIAVEMDAIVIPAAGSAATSTAYLTTYNTAGAIASGVAISFRMITGPGSEGESHDGDVFTITSSGTSQNNLTTTLLRGARYQAWRGAERQRPTEFEVDDASTFQLPEILGYDT